jgi:hypothetical protein
MVRIPENPRHELTDDGLRVYVEGPSPIALTSPEAQRLVYNYAKEAGFKDYGMNKFVDSQEPTLDNVFRSRGYWLLKPTQWNTRTVRV